jgi:hypothetical protein
MLDGLESGKDIAKRVDRLLKKADAYGRFPTPVEDIVEAAKLTSEDDYSLDESIIAKLPASLRKVFRTGVNKIQGLADRRERVIHVAPEVTVAGRRRFIAMHETTHMILPHQQDLLYADDNETLSASTNFVFEQEANHGAAELLFQRDGFARDAADSEISMAAVVDLSERYGASIQAAFRRYTECHPGGLVGLVLSPTPIANAPDRWKRYEYMSTPDWRRKLGKPFWPQILSAADHPFLAAFSVPGLNSVPMIDAAGTRRDVHVEVFNTTHRALVLLWLPQGRRLIPRRKVRFDN